MNECQSNTLYNAVRNSDKIVLVSTNNNNYSICFCVTEKWCVNHTGFSGFKNYNKNENNCCICLDCCSWCLEFHIKKPGLCKNSTNCYLCCFAIYFT